MRLETMFILVCMLSATALAQYAENGHWQNASDTVNEKLLEIVENLRQIAAPLALVLMVFAGLIYAICQPLDKETRMKGQRWSISIITGTVVGVLIIIGAPFIVGFIAGLGA